MVAIVSCRSNQLVGAPGFTRMASMGMDEMQKAVESEDEEHQTHQDACDARKTAGECIASSGFLLRGLCIRRRGVAHHEVFLHL